MLATLDPQLLYVIVFGPGVGESIVLRIPPNGWIIVDGLLVEEVSPAAELLEKLGVEWSAVVLTHDHEDHAPGLARVLELSGRGPVGCAAPFLAAMRGRLQGADGTGLLQAGNTQDTLAKIDQRWDDHPEAKWELAAGTERKIADARFAALWPDRDQLPEYRPGLENAFSTPLLVEWRRVRLLLGADLPSAQWEAVGRAFQDRNLPEHCLFKVSHHGSHTSLSDVYAPADHPEMRTWIVTPYTRSRVPRFEDGDGIHRLLQKVPELHLTATHSTPGGQSGAPLAVTRAALCATGPGQAAGMQLGPGVSLVKKPKCRPEQVLSHHVVAAGFREDGTRAEMRHGQGTLRVRE